MSSTIHSVCVVSQNTYRTGVSYALVSPYSDSHIVSVGGLWLCVVQENMWHIFGKASSVICPASPGPHHTHHTHHTRITHAHAWHPYHTNQWPHLDHIRSTHTYITTHIKPCITTHIITAAFISYHHHMRMIHIAFSRYHIRSTAHPTLQRYMKYRRVQ